MGVIRQLYVTHMARPFEKQLVLRCILNLEIERFAQLSRGQTRDYQRLFSMT
jgi:hypothetical protein